MRWQYWQILQKQFHAWAIIPKLSCITLFPSTQIHYSKSFATALPAVVGHLLTKTKRIKAPTVAVNTANKKLSVTRHNKRSWIYPSSVYIWLFMARCRSHSSTIAQSRRMKEKSRISFLSWLFLVTSFISWIISFYLPQWMLRICIKWIAAGAPNRLK